MTTLGSKIDMLLAFVVIHGRKVALQVDLVIYIRILELALVIGTVCSEISYCILASVSKMNLIVNLPCSIYP